MSSTIETFTWIFEDFSHFNTSIGRTFSLDANPNARFYLELFPHGVDGYLVDYVLVKIHFERSDKSIDEARIELSFTKTDGTRWKFLEGTLYRQVSQFAYSFPFSLQTNVYRNYLFDPNNALLPNCKLTINCDVSYDIEKVSAPSGSLSLPKTPTFAQTQLQSDYQALLQSGQFSDVVFVVGGEEFALHKSILTARSPVFGTMFQSQFAESKEGKVEISDCSAEAFEQLLQYIYAGAVLQVEKFALELFEAADKYQLESLKRICAERLAFQLTIDTAASVLLLADMHCEDELKRKCIEFISQHSKEVRATEGWKEILKAKRIELLNELIDRME